MAWRKGETRSEAYARLGLDITPLAYYTCPQCGTQQRQRFTLTEKGLRESDEYRGRMDRRGIDHLEHHPGQAQVQAPQA